MIDQTKKIKQLAWVTALSGTVSISLILAMCTGCNDNVGKYVVTDKSEDTIFYKPVGGHDFNVMVFDQNEIARDNLMYKYANIGDTIYGLRAEMDNPISIPVIKSKKPVIQAINGRTYQVLKNAKEH